VAAAAVAAADAGAGNDSNDKKGRSERGALFFVLNRVRQRADYSSFRLGEEP
jgi:hypothetical protein